MAPGVAWMVATRGVAVPLHPAHWTTASETGVRATAGGSGELLVGGLLGLLALAGLGWYVLQTHGVGDGGHGGNDGDGAHERTETGGED